jgi:exodeoxyribonuclease III
MRLVTWNCCRGPYAKNIALLDALAPDIAVLQECAKPLAESGRCLWFGDNPRQGVAVQAYGDYRLRALPELKRVPKYIIPVEVTGPTPFLLLAIWAKRDPRGSYCEAIIRAVKMYRKLFAAGQDVVAIGDFNSNAIWDAEHAAGLSHTALVELLAGWGLVSSYHAFHGEVHGQESRPTYYFTWKQERPYHLDYCFVPKAWAARIRTVDIGSYEHWKPHSDHRPLSIDVRELPR